MLKNCSFVVVNSTKQGIIGFEVNQANDLFAVANSGEVYRYDFNKLLISDLT